MTDPDPARAPGPCRPWERVALEAEIAAREGRHRFNLGDWDDRTADQRELDMRISSAVAAQAVHDAGLEAERMKAQLFAFGAHLPAIRRALTIAVADSQYEAEAKPYRAAIQALGIQDRSDEKGSQP